VFQFVGAMNPCPCGWLGHASGRCVCVPEQVRRYRRRVSGALYDRIDMSIEVPAVTAGDMDPAAARPAQSTSDAARERVAGAHRRQIDRQGKPNARLAPGEVERHCGRGADVERLLAQAMSRLSLSARGYHRVLKVARTIADVAGSEAIAPAHVAEAIGYRREIGNV
jgi:magnesium chelatase family protein